MQDDDPEVTPLPVRRDNDRHRRQLVRFEPTFSTGQIAQVVVLLIGGVTAYGTYTADKAADRAEVAQIKRDAETQRMVVKEALGDLKSDVRDMQRTLTEVSQSIAVLKARQPDPQRRNP